MAVVRVSNDAHQYGETLIDSPQGCPVILRASMAEPPDENQATMSQCSFASTEYAMRKKRTRRDKFLTEMERAVPWPRLTAVIDLPHPGAAA